ncbi:MAG: UvrD-helicase domain-containing protein, partial [Lachnospiraceae bacterium]|nr:UvrD-helicase domain-containing protein [Lachnospiraceae bacterium]
MEYTEEQKRFIDDRGHNILVSAAAGSGKTAVIVERVLKLVKEDGYDVSELLLVTFTRAAAAEMRDRIREALSQSLLSDTLEDSRREHLQKQMTLIFSADITTIDSFCLDLVRENFNICRIDPSFRVADEGELKLIAGDVMESLLEEKYETGDEAFYRFVDDVSRGRDDSAVAEAIRSVYGFAVARPDPAGYIKAMINEYDINGGAGLNGTAFIRELMSIAGEKTAIALKTLVRAGEICEMPSGPYTYGDTIQADLEEVRKLLGKSTYADMQAALREVRFGTLSRKSDASIDPELKEQVKRLRDRAKRMIRDELAGDLFSKSEEDIIYEMRMCLPQVRELSALALEYAGRFAAEKKERGVADFSDLEHMALEILKDAETRERISGRYKELIIDEYQDCNRIQEEIFAAIANGRNYVTVGDVKQSIYSFRDACPELFADKYERYSDGSDPDSVLITLSRNFRSSIPVVEAVNCVFENIMTRKCGGALYDESQSLHYGGLYRGVEEGCPWRGEYITIDCDPDKEEDAITTEARVIASRIRELVGENGSGEEASAGGPEEGKSPLYIEDRKSHEVRKCGYGDIVILLRSVKAANDAFAKVFAEEGIPVVFDSRS